MRRRNFLKGIAAVVLQFSVFRSWRLRAASATKALIRRVRPSEPGWPKPEIWQELKGAVGGKLLEVQPLFAGSSPEHAQPILDRGSASRNGNIRLAGCLGVGAKRLRGGGA